MPKINSFIICSSFQAKNDSNGRSSVCLNSPIAIVSPPYKGTYSFTVSIGVIDLDYYSEHQMRCEIKAPNKEVIFKTDTSPTPILNEKKVKYKLPEKFRGFIINIDIRNALFLESGEYILDVYLDDNKMNSQIIPVWISEEQKI